MDALDAPPAASAWASIMEMFCCGVPKHSQVDQQLALLFEERNAMILGMNPKVLRRPRFWHVHLWQKKRHWSLVLQPAGEHFQARIVDDFVHNPLHYFSAEISSTNFFLVYEMLVDGGEPYLTLSAKPDFDPNYDLVQQLGLVGPTLFEDIQCQALNIVRSYKQYSCIGANCQHFAIELAAALGAPGVAAVLADDEAFIYSASDGVAAISVAGASVGVTATLGAAGASALSSAPPSTAVLATPCLLKSLAVGATGVGLVGSLTLIGMVFGYQAWRDGVRRPKTECAEARPVLQSALIPVSAALVPRGCRGALHSHFIITAEPAAEPQGGQLLEYSRWKTQSEQSESEEEPEAECQIVFLNSELSALEREAIGSSAAPWRGMTSWERPDWAPDYSPVAREDSCRQPWVEKNLEARGFEGL